MEVIKCNSPRYSILAESHDISKIRLMLNKLIAPYQAQLWNTGRFEIYNIKEDDKFILMNKLERAPFIVDVDAYQNGKYDFSNMMNNMMGNSKQYYTIYGNVEISLLSGLKESANSSMIEFKDIPKNNIDKFKQSAKEILGGYGSMSDSAILKDIKEIYIDGKLVGYIGFEEYDDVEGYNKVLGFGNFMIFERGKGYGTQVINDLVSKYKNKYDLIYCFVDADNTGAISLYKKLGKVYDEDGPNDNGQYYVTFYGNGEYKLEEYYSKDSHNKVKKLLLDESLFETLSDNKEYLQSLLDELSNFDYAFIDGDGNELDDEDAMEAVVQSPELLTRLGKGVCTDFVEYTREKLDERNIPYKAYDISCTDKDGDHPAHVFVVVENEGKFLWVEAAWHSEAGIHEYDSLEELFEDIARKHCIYDGENYLKSCKIRELKKSLVGMSQQETYDYVDTLPIIWKAEDAGITESLNLNEENYNGLIGLYEALSIDNVESPKQLMDWMEENITYELVNDEYGAEDDPPTKTAEEVIETGTGHCAEQSYLEYKVLDELGYFPQLIFVKENNSEDDYGADGSAHMFVVYKDDDEKYTYFEHSQEHNKGIHKFNSMSELLDFVGKNWWRYDKNSDILEVRYIDKPITGVNNWGLARECHSYPVDEILDISNNIMEEDVPLDAKWDYNKQEIIVEEKLIQSSSNKALQQNIKTEIDSGRSPKLAAAIAYSVKSRNESMNEKLANIEIESQADELVARMEDALVFSKDTPTEIEFELPSQVTKEKRKVFKLVQDKIESKYIDYEIEEEKNFDTKFTYYLIKVERKYPDDYYFDYEDPETEYAQPGQRTGKYRKNKSINNNLKEALQGKEIFEFFRLCDKLGLKTFGDLEEFAKKHKSRIEINDFLKEYDSTMSADAFLQTLRDIKDEKLPNDIDDEDDGDDFRYDDPLGVIRNRDYSNRRKNESMNNLKGELSLSELVKDSINHLVNDLGKDSDAEDFADDVIIDIENNYDVDVDFSDPLKYKNWASEVACEVSRQLNEAVRGEALNENKQELLKSMAYEDVEYDQVFDREDFDTFREMMQDQGYEITKQDLEDYYKYVDEAQTELNYKDASEDEPRKMGAFDNLSEAVDPSASFIELEGFKRDWKELGLTDDDLRDLLNLIITNPSSSIPLGSNVYKIRFSPERLNKGKDTADRVIYIEVIKSDVIYLATAFSKSDEANISEVELNNLRTLAKILNQ